jgi:hypothetical protein
MAHSANSVSSERGLMLHFQVLMPCQLIPSTTLGHQVAAAYAEIEGVSIDEHVMQRYGSILRPARVGEQVAELPGDPRYTQASPTAFAAMAISCRSPYNSHRVGILRRRHLITDNACAKFERLVGELRPKLHRYCARMTGSAVDGEDIVQDSLIKALAALPHFGVINNPEGWLFRIAHNTTLDFLRRRAVQFYRMTKPST